MNNYKYFLVMLSWLIFIGCKDYEGDFNNALNSLNKIESGVDSIEDWQVLVDSMHSSDASRTILLQEKFFEILGKKHLRTNKNFKMLKPEDQHSIHDFIRNGSYCKSL